VLLQKLSQTEDSSAYAYLKESCNMMQKINDELHKKEIHKLKEQSRELMQVISDLKLENYQLKEKLAILESKQKSYIEEPLELSFEERDCRMSSKNTPIIYSPVMNDNGFSKPIKSDIYIEESPKLYNGMNNTILSARFNECTNTFSRITHNSKAMRNEAYSTQEAKVLNSSRNKEELPIQILSQSMISEEKTRANVSTRRARRLLAGLRISLKPKTFSKLDRRHNASPLSHKMTSRKKSPTSLESARAQNISLKKDELKMEEEFTTPHFNS